MKQYSRPGSRGRISGPRGTVNSAGTNRSVTEKPSLPVPAKYQWVPEGVPAEDPYNVAQLYSKLGEAIRDGKPVSPSFDAAVTRHRLLDMIVRASETGQKQTA